MPIHSHHGTERLKPEWVAQAGQKSADAVIQNNVFGDRRTEFVVPIGVEVLTRAALDFVGTAEEEI